MTAHDSLPLSETMTGPADTGPRASMPTDSGLYAPGDLVGDKYRLLRLAGEGGMGSVWVALNTALQSQVAIKLIRSELRSKGAAERLVREARATAKLDHPAVVRAFDVGVTHWNEPFIVMELLEGESLRDLLEREQSLPAVKAVQMLLPIIDALSAAHAAGIIHRDLKPDNIFLARNAAGRLQPKLVDFGIAKVLDTEPMSAKRSLTQQGLLVGSPEYMAPEQARCLRVDGRSDIWALCVALYELVSGTRPFVGETYEQLLRAVVDARYAPLGDDVDPALAAIIERGMRKEPDERWGSMRELGQALARWLVEQGQSEDACGASVRSTWLGGDLGSLPPLSSQRGSRASLPPLEGPIFASGALPPISLKPALTPPQQLTVVAPEQAARPLPRRELGLVAALAVLVAVLAGAPQSRHATVERSAAPQAVAAAAAAPVAVPSPVRPVSHVARDLAPSPAPEPAHEQASQPDKKSDHKASHHDAVASSASSSSGKGASSRQQPRSSARTAPIPQRLEPTRTAQNVVPKTWSPLSVRPD